MLNRKTKTKTEKEKKAEYGKKWRLENKEKIKKLRLKNAKKIKQNQKKWKKNNPGYSRNWRLKNIEKVRKKDDFIFLDPPYTVAHKNNDFLEYNEKIFSWEDQQKLASCIRQLAKKKVKFFLTNAAHESIDSLYRGLAEKIEIERVSTISGVIKRRDKASEYIFTNCI